MRAKPATIEITQKAFDILSEIPINNPVRQSTEVRIANIFRENSNERAELLELALVGLASSAVLKWRLDVAHQKSLNREVAMLTNPSLGVQ